tara:strand:- start:4697 stop:5521 length:825 start_codon:yes stop_codon:yes gene_type:complete
MSLIFEEKGHLYKSIDPNEKIKWVSVTSVISKFKEPFDAELQASKSTKNKKSKWYKISPKDILDIWNKESNRAMSLGTFYHNQREKDIIDLDTLTIDGKALPIIPPKIIDGLKYAPEQKLIPGIYPEHFSYLKSAEICGQADYVEIIGNKVNIIDYKTNKEIKKRSWKNWEGIYKVLSAPLKHIEDCNLNHYTLQLSLYMYMIIKHNPKLKPGKLVVQHVVFEKEGDDKNGYPITKYQENGDPIVKEVISYDLPYLKAEVLSIIKHLKDNKNDN